MRKLFCVILAQCRPSNPGSLWHKFKDDLSRDVLYQFKTTNCLPDYTFTEIIYQQAFKLIDDIRKYIQVKAKYYTKKLNIQRFVGN